MSELDEREREEFFRSVLLARPLLLHSEIASSRFFFRLKKIQKKKGEKRAQKEKELEALKAQGVQIETGASLLEDEDETDLLFDN